MNPSPRNMELFHLRLLLLNRPGMCSWQDVLTVSGTQFETFREACEALGVSSGTAGFDYGASLAEVTSHGSSWQIRQFFAVLVAQCDLRNSTELWCLHRDKMAEDLRRRGLGNHGALSRARSEVIDRILDMCGDDFSRETLMRMLPLPFDCDEGNFHAHVALAFVFLCSIV